MIQRIASDEQIRFTREYLEENNMGNRGVFDGDYYQQLFGLQAQVIVTDLLGLPRPESGGGFDGGSDFEWAGKKWDVKCVIRSVKPLVSYACNLTESQTRYDCDGYFFVSYNKITGSFYLLGWITKEDYLSKATYHPIGSTVKRSDGTFITVSSAPFYDITIKQLNRLQKLTDVQGIGTYETKKQLKECVE